MIPSAIPCVLSERSRPVVAGIGAGGHQLWALKSEESRALGHRPMDTIDDAARLMDQPDSGDAARPGTDRASVAEESLDGVRAHHGAGAPAPSSA